MSPLSNSQHEAFTQARFHGASVMDAYRAAGYHGITPQAAAKISQHPDVKARLKELHDAAATAMAYERNDAIADLVAIIKAKPSEASTDHPLCEVRSARGEEYHRFPSKLRAMARLMKIMGWGERRKAKAKAHGDDDDDDNSDATFDRMRFWMARERKLNPLADSYQEPEEPRDPDELNEPPEDPTGELAAAAADPTAPLSPKQEAFAQARARGNGVMRSYQLACYFGHSAKCATRVNQRANVQARIAQLRKLAEEATPPERRYQKHEAINDLIAIIHACPGEAGPDHSLCEKRMGAGSSGPYYRFPCKLQAIALLARLMGWNAGDTTAEEPPVGGEQLDAWDKFWDSIHARAEAEKAEWAKEAEREERTE